MKFDSTEKHPKTCIAGPRWWQPYGATPCLTWYAARRHPMLKKPCGFNRTPSRGNSCCQRKHVGRIRRNLVPIVARFQGIGIYMYTEVDTPHHLPHFHVRYHEYRASFAIDPPVLLAASLPRRQMRLVLAWAELHQQAITENWRRLDQGLPAVRIEGL